MTEIATPPLRIDTLRQQAETMAQTRPYPIATEPRLLLTGNQPRLERLAEHCSLDRVVEFAAEAHGQDPSTLSALAIQLTSRRGIGAATLRSQPIVHEGSISYPFIELRALPEVSAGYLGFKLRHEFRHVFQPDTVTVKSRLLTDVGSRAIGAMAAGGAYWAARHGLFDTLVDE